jgi:hypothetical protein
VAAARVRVTARVAIARATRGGENITECSISLILRPAHQLYSSSSSPSIYPTPTRVHGKNSNMTFQSESNMVFFPPQRTTPCVGLLEVAYL